MKCPYCGGSVKLVSASVVYHSNKYGNSKVWVCVRTTLSVTLM